MAAQLSARLGNVDGSTQLAAHLVRPRVIKRCKQFPVRNRLGGESTNPSTPRGRAQRKALGTGAAASLSGNVEAPDTQLLGTLKYVLTLPLWPEGVLQHFQSKSKEIAAYVSMARPINLLPSALLVFLGAWAGSGRSLLALRLGSVWLMSLLSGSIAVASVVVNDYFDYKSGVDVVNGPDKPLPSGVVPPDGALLLSSMLYMGVLIAACLMEPPLLRLVIASSAALTLLYTPLLKRITCVKNATVACIIAASPMAGALAAGAGGAGLARILAPCAFVFLGIMYREVLMDLNDTEGDRDAGIWTLPVMVGRGRALGTAVGFFALATAMAVGVALTGSGLAWAWNQHAAPEAWVRALSTAVVLAIVQPLFMTAANIWRKNFDKRVVGAAVDDSMKAIGLGMCWLAAIA